MKKTKNKEFFESQKPTVSKKKITVKGMTCKSCVHSIEENVSELKGVKNIDVDLIKETAEIEFDEKKIKLDKIKQTIIDSGYKIQGKKPKKRGFREALIYGLIPHIGCIAFVFASIFGATLLMQFFKPLLMNRYFFHALVAISFGFATLSAFIYLRKEGFLSMLGIRRKWRYLLTMYGTTIGVNLILFLLIFPMLANVSAAGDKVGESDSTIMFSVNIPCSGHAPLISEELKSIEGVNAIEYSFPNNFEVSFDSAKTSKQEMLALEVFDEYPATVVDSNSPVAATTAAAKAPSSAVNTCDGSCGCGGGY